MTRPPPATPTGSCSWPTGASSTRWTTPPRPASWSGCGSWVSSMLRTSFKNMLAHRRRLTATAVAVILGVALVAGTLVLTDTISQTFGGLFGTVYQGTDAVVRGKAAFTGPQGSG